MPLLHPVSINDLDEQSCLKAPNKLTPRGSAVRVSSDLTMCNVSEWVDIAARTVPNHVALTSGASVMRYGELLEMTDRAACHLHEMQVGPNDLVAVCIERSIMMVVAQLAVLKAGAAYLPIDPSVPRERIQFMLEDGHPKLLIGEGKLCRLVAGKSGLRTLALDELSKVATRPPACPTSSRYSSSDLAYVIYTSGSTGRPKAVEISNAGLLNLISWHNHAFAITAADRASQFASPGFDAAVWEIWPYLTAGASIRFVPEATRVNPEQLRDWLEDNEISISFLPTPLAEQMLRLNWPVNTSLRTLLIGADTLHEYPSQDIPFTVVNNYGPTECTVVATSGVVSPVKEATPTGHLPPIGLPISNTEIYILDEDMNLVSDGSEGDIYIGGAGLARGYRNRPDLTSQAFVAHPYNSAPGARLYRTGDRGRRLPDGQLLFLGRADDQIKIRGHRIEPSEIVQALNRHRSVRESLVVAEEPNGQRKALVAYFVCENNRVPSANVLRRFLRKVLPEFMVPAAFIQVDKLPVGLNGKVDRRQLSLCSRRGVNVQAPLTPAETSLCNIFADALGSTEVGTNDNFFESGGHSLSAAQVVQQVRSRLGIDLRLGHFYKNPSVAELAFLIRSGILLKIAKRPSLQVLMDETDRTSLTEQFPVSAPIASPLLIGRMFDWRPTSIYGGVCIENDVSRPSINTFYQMLVPLRLAREYGCPAAMCVPVMEEMIRHPQAQRLFFRLGLSLEDAVRRLARDFAVEVQIVNTAASCVNTVVESVRREIDVNLAPSQVASMYSYHNGGRTAVPGMPRQQIHVNERFIACHTATGVAQLTGRRHVLIVEDTEQKDAVALASLSDASEAIDFLPFIPCPDLAGRGPMFRASGNDYISLSSSTTEILQRLSAAPLAVQDFYSQAAALLPPACEPTVASFVNYSAQVMTPGAASS